MVKSFRPHLVLHFTAAVCCSTSFKQRVSLLINMARHTRIQLRETILRLWKQGKSSQTIALTVGVGKSTVSDFLTKYRSGYSLKAVFHKKPLFGWTKSSNGSLQWILVKQQVISLANYNKKIMLW